jgi:hypothetical protein
MSEIKRVKINSILESQIPEFLNEESPLFVEFLNQYYHSLEHQSGTLDLLNNLKKYKNIESFNKEALIKTTSLSSNVLSFDTIINVDSTVGWPDKYGLLKIDDEIITYLSKTETSFIDCVRGFSGIDNITSVENVEFLNFSSTNASEHSINSKVNNLSNLFLVQFFEKYRFEFFPGFESRDFVPELSLPNILTGAKDFYSSKGTDSSYKLLFKILYGTDIEIIKPQDNVLVPSSNLYFITKNILVEKISGLGNPTDLPGNFLYQTLPGIGTVSASIFNVEYRPIQDKELYEISLDSTSLDGTFQVSGKTKIMEDVQIGSDTILVDSTIGFAKQGTFIVKTQTSDLIEINYQDKTTNQFLEVTGVDRFLEFGTEIVEEKFATSFVGFGNTSPINFRIINVIDSVDSTNTSNMRVGDTVKLSGFGKDLREKVNFNSWIYNIPTSHNIKNINKVNTNLFRVVLYDEVFFYLNEVITISDENKNKLNALITSIEYPEGRSKKFSNRILIQVDENSFNINNATLISKKINKSNHNINYFPEINKIPTGIQNTYLSVDGTNMYVTSTGTPNYTMVATDNKVTVSTFGIGTTDTFFSLNHPYTTGETVYYQPKSSSGIGTGRYQLTKIDNNSFKLSFSKSDIFSKQYVQFNSGITDSEVVKDGYQNKNIKNQKLLKRINLIPTPLVEYDDENLRKTTQLNKQIGMLVNGVELFSPTIFDESIYYGKLTSIEVIDSGVEYDIINSPPVQINDDFGFGAKASFNITGTIKEVKILSQGVGYQSKPKITVTGGNGVGCVLESNLVSSKITASFKSDVGVSVASNTITFEDPILFDDNEEVLYTTNGNLAIPGIVDQSNYFIGIVTNNVIKLYNSKEDSFGKINEINITGISSGVHNFTTLKNKNTISQIYVKNSGKGYSNRSVRVPSILSSDNNTLGINTFDSYIFAKNHGFNSGEIVRYSYTGSAISGLSSDVSYYVDVINSDKFKLASAGIGETLGNINFINKRYESLSTLGVGTHIISYPPIEINIESLSSIESATIIQPVLKPIVLGSIEDVFLEDGGVSFGCTDIINFHRRPFVGLSSISSQVLLKPIIIDGSIVDIQIVNRGRGYRKDAYIIVSGPGKFAEIESTVENGSLISTNILNGGIGYASTNTTLTLQNRGVGLKLLANVNEWKINQVIKSKNIISDDDGLIYPSQNPSLGLRFVNFYIPRKLRLQLSDNINLNFTEVNGTLTHSPLLGYAYDGNPIYGPYGYENSLGGPIKRLVSGYVDDVNSNFELRPPGFEVGYFIDDYKFIGTGDLDEYNGRFCITPEFPNGIYAYFSTIVVNSSGGGGQNLPSGISAPAYPYLIGDKFKDVPILDNFVPKFNQDFDIFDTSLSRNIGPYYLNNTNSRYELIDNVLDDYKQELRVENINSDIITDAIVFSPGDNYQVDDLVLLDNSGTQGSSANIVVSRILGKSIFNFEISNDTIDNVEFTIRSNNITGETSSPHGLLNNQPIKISGISTVTSSNLEGIRYIKVNQKEVQLQNDVDLIEITGFSTKIVVTDTSGFEPNDFIGIGTEVLQITKISKKESYFEANRISNTGVHTVGVDNVKLLPKKFEFLVDGNISNYTFGNKTIFFNPKEDVGTGVAGTTRVITGLSTSFSRTIPKRSIYIPGHKFFTGEKLIYSCGAGGTSLFVNNVGSAISFKLENNQEVYAVNLGNDYLGISTIGFTSTSGIGSQFNSLEFQNLDQFFGVIGAGHSLTTTNPKITGTIESASVEVTTVGNHGLLTGDEIKLTVNISDEEELKVIFDPVNRKTSMREILFTNGAISTTDSTIDISSYTGEIKTGDKVVYISDNSINGLINYGIYYVLKDNPNKIKLCKYISDIYPSESILGVTLPINNIKFNSTGGSNQKLYFVNPQLTFFRGNTIKFDLSDPSLLDMDLFFYTDFALNKKIEVIGSSSGGFVITREGIPGNPDAYVYLNTSVKDSPRILYYNLVPKGLSESEKTQISIDTSVIGHNHIVLLEHSFNDTFKVNVADDNTFSFVNNKILSYIELQSLSTANIRYDTNSKNVLGPISKLKINFGGRGYKKLPIIKGINSNLGNNAVVKLISPNIGKIESFSRVKDGFDYPTDPTLSPLLSVPSVVGIKDIRTIESVSVIFGGNNYNIAPTLVVPSNPKIKLQSVTSGGSVESVKIITNSNELSGPLEILSIRNSNGFDIDFITVVGNLITLELSNTEFISSSFGSTDFVFPFKIGDQIFIENCRLTLSTRNLNNFNSVDYGYKFFTVVAVDTNNYTITYDISSLPSGLIFGTYNDTTGLGFVVNKKDMPIFEMNLVDTVNYFSNEIVTTNKFNAIVMENGWDGKLNQLRLDAGEGNLEIGAKLFGQTSKVNGTIEYFDTFILNSILGVSRDKVGNIDNSVGILNEFQQRISDNFYYQKFSYSIKGNIPYGDWKEAVRSLVHPSGFKEFSDLVIYSKPEEVSYSSATLKPRIVDSETQLNINIDNKSLLYERSNFSKVYEEDSLPDGSVERVYIADGLTLKPFIMNNTNKVLKIDDISNQFTGISNQELGGSIVGLTTFKLKNKRTPLFKHVFDSQLTTIDVTNNKFIIPNHNYQTGQKLIYEYDNSPIGVATTSYVSGITSSLIAVGNFDGTAIFENGYNVSISTTITGISTTLVPSGPSFQTYLSVIGFGTTGINAEFNVFITYSNSTGIPIGTSIILNKGGRGFKVGDVVSIAGTYLGGSTPTNDLSFIVSKTAPTSISTQSNVLYTNIPSLDSNGAVFDVGRDDDGFVSTVEVIDGGVGYSSTSIISIAGTYVGGTENDVLRISPTELGTKVLPKEVYVLKLNDNEFRVSGLNTSVFLDLVGIGSGSHSLSYDNPNSSIIITIDGVIQSALRRKSLQITLSEPISTATTTFIKVSSGISSLNTNDIININNELLVVKSIGISSANNVEVNRGYFDSISGIHTVGASCTVLTGDFTILGDVLYFTTPPYGKIGPVGLETGSIFGGRVFSRKFDPSLPADKNIILDDISLSFTGSATSQFSLKSDGEPIQTLFNNVNDSLNINNNPIILINNVFQNPSDKYVIEDPIENDIQFIDGVPSAGKIVRVGVTSGFGYQPLLVASAKAVVSSSGTISSIILNGQGGGYRQPPVISIASTIGFGASVVATVGLGGTITGFTIVNPGFGYTTTSIPNVVIGIPTGYSNLPLEYFESSGSGQQAKITVNVGMGSSIISFKFDEPGFGYKVGDVLFAPGITTNPYFSGISTTFLITVEEVQTDKFSGFYPGQFIKFSDISNQFNGFRKRFTLRALINGESKILDLRVPKGSDLDVTNNIFIYINDILQTPGESYTFNGSRLIFTEAPKPDSLCSILYYRGSSVDVEEVVPPSTIKEGDFIIIKENKNDPFDIDQFDRVVKNVISSDQFDTFTYDSLGISTDPNKERPLTWIKQKNDRIINGSLYSKSRPDLKSVIRPQATIIKNVTASDNQIYVDNVYPIFSDVDGLVENLRDLLIFENRIVESSTAETQVSASSSVSNVNVTFGGIGYQNITSPEVFISFSAITQKDPIFNWSESVGISPSYELNSIIYGNVFVGIGNTQSLVISPDGKTWQSSIIGLTTSSDLKSIISHPNNQQYIYVSVGSNGTVVRSIGTENSISTWSNIPLREERIVPGFGVVDNVNSSYLGTLNDVVYSPSYNSYVTVGTAGSIFVGTGVGTDSFISKTSSVLSNLNSVSFSFNTSINSGYFVAVGDNGIILTSNSGQIWDTSPAITTQTLNKVIFAEGKFVIVGNNGTVIRSINQNQYELIPTNIGVNFVNIKYNYGIYAALDDVGDLYYSLNLTEWNKRSTNQSNIIKDLVFVDTLGNDGRYVIVGFGGTSVYAEPIYNRATAVASVSSGIVTSINVINGGFGYSPSDLPQVIIESDIYNKELVRSFKALGDHGIIVGINTFITGTPGIGTTNPKIEFVLKSETYDNSTLGIGYSALNSFGITGSQLEKGDYFIITDSNVTVGHALTGITTSLGGMSNYPASKVGTARSFIDGVYRVEHVTIPVLGIVTVTCNFAPSPFGNFVQVYGRGDNNSGINTNNFYGKYSWGKLFDYQNRILGNPKTFITNTDDGIVGLSSSPKVIRTRGLVSK